MPPWHGEPDEPRAPYIDEPDSGVYFIVDDNGEPIRHPACDAGPWSVRQDAVNALNDFLVALDDSI